MDEVVRTQMGTAITAFLLHDWIHEDGRYCVAISMSNNGDTGTRSSIVRASLTVDEILDTIENPAQSPVFE